MVDPARGRALSEPVLIPDGLDAVLVLVRHGESTFVAEGRFQGRSDPPLSETGLRQAALVASRLARPDGPPALPLPNAAPVEIVHSPLRRAAATAEKIADAMAEPDAFSVAPPTRADAGLTEIGQGEWEGRLSAEVGERWGETLAAWRRHPTEVWAPGGESIEEVARRVRPAIASVLGSMGGTSEAVHPIRPARSQVDRGHVLGYGAADAGRPWSIVVGHDGTFRVALLTLLEVRLERFWSFPFALCGISIIELRDGRATLRAHNLTDHLSQPAGAPAARRERERSESGAL